ncbi:MAG: glycine zipper domain-containing protein [Caulobacter sp.]|nr:glycine zipper domain-containing protein [Caulobacter sp.]
MRTILTLSAAIAIAAPAFVMPTLAEAQSGRSYGRGDVCNNQRDRAGRKGTVTGALIGGTVGAAAASDGVRGEGAVLGGVIGAVAGNQIAKRNFKCSSYPRRVSTRRGNCKWVQEYYGGRWHGFEVCRGRDGYWRPSGRA